MFSCSLFAPFPCLLLLLPFYKQNNRFAWSTPPSSQLAANYLMAAFLFSKASTGGISAALGECFDFLWHAPGYREDRRGLLGVEVLNFSKQGGSTSIFPFPLK